MKTLYNLFLFLICLLIMQYIVETDNIVLSTLGAFAISVFIRDLILDFTGLSV